MTTLSYDYKPKAWIMILAIAFFGACAAWAANLALTNDRGLILSGIIEFSRGGATTFFWVLCAVSAVFVGVGVLALLKAYTSPKKIVLGATGISAPRLPISQKIIEIPYAEATITETTVQGQVFLEVRGKNSKISILQSSMTSKEQFSDMRDNLSERIEQMSR